MAGVKYPLHFTKMKIGLLTISHKRPKIDKIFCLMVDRLRRDYPDLFVPVCVVSLEEDKKVFEEHDIETYIFPNSPLGAKHNYGLSKLRGRCTHVLHLGSDDVINNRYMDELIKNADKDIVWGTGITFFSSSGKRARYWAESNRGIGGPGKFINAKILDRVDWHIWEDCLERNLDASVNETLKPVIRSKKLFEAKKVGGLLMDIKSEMNLHHYQLFINNGFPVETDAIYSKLSKEEAEYLKSLN